MSVSCIVTAVTENTLTWLREEPRRLGQWKGDEDDEVVDLDKAWHAIHILLCGVGGRAALPAGFLLGGEELDDGYAHEMGLPQTIACDEVGPIAALLEGLSADELVDRWNSRTMVDEDLYYLASELDDRDYITTHYDQLRALVAQAHEDGRGLLIRRF